MNPVATTALLVAAIRAEETARADRLFDDPFAAAVAGEDGRAMLARYRGGGPPFPVVEVRIRWYDDAIAKAIATGIRQVVILAAGMDTRAYRLSWPDGTRLFEIDQPEMIARKSVALAAATPRCNRIAIGADLAGEWQPALTGAGFEPKERTLWLVEGLLQYIDRAAVERLFARVHALSAPRSIALYDIIGQSLLESPVLGATLTMMKELGAPWIFGTDDPGSLLPAWDVVVTEPAIVGTALKRWPVPLAPAGVPGVPRGYLIEATKP